MASPVNYKIYLHDTDGVKVAEFNNFIHLKFDHRVNSVGKCEFTLYGTDSRISLFELDSFIEVWRSVPSMGISWYKEWEGFYRDESRFTQESGGRYFHAVAYSYLHLLQRRTIAYREGSAYTKKADAGETVLKEFVYENAGAGATNPPRVGDGVFPGLSIQADGNLGSIWYGERSFKNLLQTCQEISLAVGDVDFDIVRTTDDNFEFRTYNPLRGADRTTVGLDPDTGVNGSGNVPVTFSMGNKTMLNPQYTFLRGVGINRAYVIGQGEKSNKVIQIVDNAVSIAESPWNQFETSVNASNQEDDDELDTVGSATIEAQQAKEELSFDALQQPAAYYGKQFTWGDRVTAVYDGEAFHKKVVSVEVTVQGGSSGSVENIQPEFADV